MMVILYSVVEEKALVVFSWEIARVWVIGLALGLFLLLLIVCGAWKVENSSDHFFAN